MIEITGARGMSFELSSSYNNSLISPLAISSIPIQDELSFSSFTSNDSAISEAVSKSI
jgi:hypothetical protein